MPFRSTSSDSFPGERRRAYLRAALAAPALLWAKGVAFGQGTPAEPAPPLMIKVLMEELPPYSFTGAEGRPSGYAFELAKELLVRAKLPASFEFNSWARVMLRSRTEAQVLVPAIVRLPEREWQFHWLGQIASRRGTLFRLKSRPDIKLDRIDPASPYRIGVVKDDVSERELVALGLDAQQLDRSADHAGLLRRFFAERTDLLALNPALAPALLQQFGFDPGLIEPVLKFSDSRPSIALSLRTDDLTRQRLQQAWDAMRRDGSVTTIAARYPMIALD